MESADPDRRLQHFAAELRRRDELLRVHREHAQQIAQLEARRLELQRAVGAASDRLHELGSFGWERLVRTLRGDRRRLIATLSAELQLARERHDECDTVLARLLDERTRVDAELHALDTVPQQYAALCADKEARLRQRGGELAERLLGSAALLARLAEQRRGLERFGGAAGALLASTEDSEAELRERRSQVGADLVVAGAPGFERVRRELQDFAEVGPALVAAEPELQAAAAEFATFAAAELRFEVGVRPERIVEALQRVAAVRDRLRELIWQCDRRDRELEQDYTSAAQQRVAWIEQAG